MDNYYVVFVDGTGDIAITECEDLEDAQAWAALNSFLDKDYLIFSGEVEPND